MSLPSSLMSSKATSMFAGRCSSRRAAIIEVPRDHENVHMERRVQHSSTQPCQEVRGAHSRGQHFLRRAEGRNVRVPWTKWRGKDHDHKDADHAPAANKWNSQVEWPESSGRKGRSAKELWHRVPGPESGPGPDGLGKHGIPRHALSCPGQSAARAYRDASKAFRPLGAARIHGKAVFGWNEKAPRDRARPAAHTENLVPRRADFRSGPAESQSDVDASQTGERGGAGYRLPDDSLHGRS